MKIFKKCFVFLLGFIFAFGVFEGILRLVYTPESYTRIDSTFSRSSDPNYTILFLGNSHTFGAGVNPKDAYPDVLQRFFNKNLSSNNYKVRIINAGKNTANTSEIYAALDAQIQEYHPNMVHVMAGEPNYWNKNGMGDFLAEKYGYGLGIWPQTLLYLSKYSKFFRWITSISDLSKSIHISNDLQTEITVFKTITEAEDHYIKFITKNAENTEIYEKISQFINSKKANPPNEIWRTLLYIHSRYQFYLTADIESVIKQIKYSIAFDANEFDIFSYLLINELLGLPNLQSQYKIELKKILNDLVKENAEPGVTVSNKCAKYTLTSNDRAISAEERESVLIKCQKLFPAFALPAEGLNAYYSEHNRPQEAFRAIIKTISVNPFARRNEIKKHLLHILDNHYADIETKSTVRKLISEFSEKYPSEAYLYRSENGEKISEWIDFDLKRIANKSSAAGASIVFQNYHWLRNKPEGVELNQIIERFALSFQVPLIDINTPFVTTVKNSGNVESYFTQVFGPNDSHPSELGHRLIAYLMYSEMIRQKLLPDELSHFNAQDILDGKY